MEEPTSTASLPEGRWMLRMPPMVLDEGNQGRWISGGSGLLRLEARLRARSDALAPLRLGSRQLTGHQGLRRGQLGRVGGSREEIPLPFP